MSDRDNSDYLKSGNEWSVNTLDFMFWQLRPDYYLPDYDEANGFQQCTDEMKEAVREIFAHISTFADLTFTEVTDVAQTELGFGQASLAAGELAHAYYPVAAGDAREGDVWVSTLFPENYELEAGEEGYYTLLHEIGHALGLQHSFTDPDYPEDEDDTRYTVMSYTFPVMPKTYMLYDILALQEIYGANMTYRTGDDAYAFSPGEVYNTIWDAGGTDTITAATHTANAVIDLRQGEFSYIGASSMIIAFDVTIENAVGGYGNDTLHENGGDNTIDAGWGNDTVYAQDDGDDTIDGDLGNDTVIFEGVLGDYTVVYVDPTTWTVERSGGDLDTLLNFETFVFDGEIFSQSRLFAYRGPGVGFVEEGTSGDDVMTGGALNDTFWAKGGDDTLAGLAGDDRLYGETGDDILDGGDDNDTLDGSTGNDTLTGGDGDDTLVSGTGTDIVDGGNGNDLAILAGERYQYIATLNLDGSVSLEYLGADIDVYRDVEIFRFPAFIAGSFDYTLAELLAPPPVHLEGTKGADTFTGTNGHDYLSGGAGGSDVLTGLDGDDVISGGSGSGSDTIDAGDGDDRVFGSAGGDTIDLGDGDDVVQAGGGNDIIYGGIGNDDIRTDAGNDTVYGGDGNDVITGIKGSELFYGGAGDDDLDGSEGGDRLFGEDDNDNLDGMGGNDRLDGGDGNDYLNGGFGNDTLTGGTGADTLQGVAGNDVLFGGDDNDTMYGGDGSDTLWGDGDDDTLSGELGSDKLNGGAGADILNGNEDRDTLAGDAGDDTLDGGAGDDTLQGGADNDTLSGGLGKDKLSGGLGSDVFLFDTAPAKGNEDTISDFTAGDVVDIRAILAAYDPLTDILSDFVDVTMQGKNAVVKVDIDGALNGQQFVTVATLQKVTFADETAMVTAGALLVS